MLKLIKKKTVETYLNKKFSTEELNYFLKPEDFAQYLDKMNHGQPFDAELAEQLFTRMSEIQQTPKPTMAVFPKTFMEAIESLDRKMDSKHEQIKGLEDKQGYIDQTISDLKFLKRKGKLPFKKQVRVTPVRLPDHRVLGLRLGQPEVQLGVFAQRVHFV